MSDLFDTPLSSPPRLHLLRQAYDDARAALDAAEANADETGEPIPNSLRREFHRAALNLTAEEAHIASQSRP